jgi:WD40 repeat protein
MVREVFRNLVTAQGTRAAADREELLSVFPERHAAEEVLGALIDARLLTSYEVAAGPAGEAKEAARAEEGPRHRIEIVHESLVKAWPRLVWWQAQDEEGARLRDQLRQAAHLWEEKGRSPDVLWSGTAFREFELWRERYPGGLTALEEAFARAMTERERRRARLRRTAAASVVVGLAAVAIAIGISREQTARARDRAVAEARRAEAGKLIALGQLQLDTYPTAALAYARKSLERFDTPEARRLAVQALWRGPVARILPLQGGGNLVAFSPDGRWVAASTPPDGDVHLFGEDGAPGPVLTSPRKGADGWLAFDARGDRLVTWAGSDLAAYSVPEGRALGVLDLGEGMHWVQPRAAPDGGLFTLTFGKDRFRVREWPHDGGTPTELGSMEVGPKTAYPAVDPTGTWLATYDLATGDFEFRRLRQLAAGRPKRLGAKLSERLWAATSFATSGDRLVTAVKEGNIRLWSTAASRKEPLLALKAQDPDWADSAPRFDATGRRLSWASLVHGVVYMWDLDGPPEADPLVLHAPLAGSGGLLGAAFHPGGGWLAEGGFGVAPAFWAVGLPYPRVLRSPTGGILRFAVSPDSRRLVGAGFGGLRLWALQPRGRPERLALEGIWYLPLFDAGGRLYAAQWHGPGPPRTSAYLVPTDGSPPRLLTRFASSRIDAMALDREGRRLAVATGAADPPETPLVRILHLSTGTVRDFPVEAAPGAAPIRSLAFAADGALVSGGEGGVQSWNTETGERRSILAAGFALISASADGRRLVAVTFKGRDIGPDAETTVVDLDTGTHRTTTTHRSNVVALDPSGQILVSGGEDGAVRVGPATGEEPHLLLGHTSRVGCVGVTPDGRWVVSVAGNEVRLWPMPDVSKPPFHTLPYGELMTRLGAMTNVQVVEDGSSPTGYKVDVGPFPGWRDMPAW